MQPNENEFLLYVVQSDKKEIGKALKKQYNKELQQKLDEALTNEEIEEYLKNGKVTINGVEILEGWLKVTGRKFRDQYINDPSYGVDS